MDPMVDDNDGPRLARYITGDCSPEERAAVRRSLEENAAWREYVEALERVWKATARAPSEWDVDAALLQLRAAKAARQVRPLRTPTGTANPTPDPGWRPPRAAAFTLPSHPSPIRIAATIALIVGSAAVWWVSARHASLTGDPAGPMRLYTTARGERADLHLPDGTRVLLGTETRMRLPADFGIRDRRVGLEGQAYFAVRHDRDRPFLVSAGNAVTEDLGTEFAVRSYPGEAATEVVVAEGKVALRVSGMADGTGTALSQGDLGRLDSAGVTTVTADVNVNRYVAWTRGRITFENQALGQVIPELERWFDVTIELADTSLASIRVTASFEHESSVEAVQTLARLLDVRYERTERTFRLRD